MEKKKSHYLPKCQIYKCMNRFIYKFMDSTVET